MRLSLGDVDRWIYLSEETYRTMCKISIADFRKSLSAEWGETSRYWHRISQRVTKAYEEDLEHFSVPRENYTRPSCAVYPGQQLILA